VPGNSKGIIPQIMLLFLGLRLRLYEIVTLFGAGGMGEGYRAAGTRLGHVAARLSPVIFAHGYELVA